MGILHKQNCVRIPMSVVTRKLCEDTHGHFEKTKLCEDTHGHFEKQTCVRIPMSAVKKKTVREYS